MTEFKPNGARALLSQPLESAARIKWDRGREEYGGDDWVGDHPLVELHDELLDGLNYAAEARRRFGAPVLDIETRLRGIALDLRRTLKDMGIV